MTTGPIQAFASNAKRMGSSKTARKSRWRTAASDWQASVPKQGAQEDLENRPLTLHTDVDK